MERLKGKALVILERDGNKEIVVTGLAEGVDVDDLGPEERDAQVAKLDRPWVGDEGPLDVSFHRLEGPPEGLRPRGLAFDKETTVTWDEAGVQVAQRRGEADSDVVALHSPVRLRGRFAGPAGLERLFRIDYLRAGCLIASRYQMPHDDETHQKEAAHA